MDGYREYEIVRKSAETPSVTTLWLAPREGDRPMFIPGQFVNVLLPAFGGEAKSYTIANAPQSDGFAFSVRAAGPFSQALVVHEVGGTLRVSDPCGFFYPEDDVTPRVFVMGGIGIAPLMSILRAAEKIKTPPMLLLYSNRTPADIAFQDELDEFRHVGLCEIEYFITRAERAGGAYSRRINAEDLARAAAQRPRAHYFLCGSIAFVRDMRLALKAIRIPEACIFTEAFF